MTTILHIAHAADWADALESGEYRRSSRDLSLEEEGFIHCSTAEQVAGVAASFYADDSAPLVVLVMDDAVIAASDVELRCENGGGGELFPHIYGAIDPKWVSDVRPASFANGTFSY